MVTKIMFSHHSHTTKAKNLEFFFQMATKCFFFGAMIEIFQLLDQRWKSSHHQLDNLNLWLMIKRIPWVIWVLVKKIKHPNLATKKWSLNLAIKLFGHRPNFFWATIKKCSPWINGGNCAIINQTIKNFQVVTKFFLSFDLVIED